jgi:phosphate transport system protein
MPEDIRHFADELHLLTARLREMGVASEAQVSRSMRGLVEADRTLLRQVIAGDESINRLHLEIDDRAFKLLALFQPVAVDLRSIVSAVKINSDLERIGDLAVNIAEAADRYVSHAPVKPLVDLPQMAKLAVSMLHQALEAFVSEKIALAQSVLAEDDVLDNLKDQVFRDLLQIMIREPQTVEPGLDLILISRHLERVGDHATNIAEDVIFIVEARDVRHQGGQHVADHHD